ncbi:4-diphosphocytidyl-2-C-methyl-D-erythritol kinase [Breoghania corrubedonensis]|uniref:4-diphosphocytidyl-2-C-methyl-D-erythritol kinase n=1 Tax=Breoghania corrubedonensis TaxID=665038 RepID=A0A2T5VD68_9HYPH|nr:4-(cytidine 5'-diphospho)-2-C-methyl-D-erythritol kinase [Breoghania corrubedonensis]PTW61709.1 4-diphosphocytidyl-2-C-methyl-D-erythritol kinase [Breoghania corrubedonensis]
MPAAIDPPASREPAPDSAAPIREEGRAKVNLALHVTGRRADGYHELDTLVVFPPFGDLLEVRPGAGLSLSVSGPFAADLGPADDNLVMRAATALQAAFQVQHGAALSLEKRLPVASGIGGGSADAAAALRALSRLWRLDARDPRIAEIAARLGADVPMCLASRPLRASGIGDVLSPVANLPAAGLVLVNPRVAVATPAIFKTLKTRENPPLGDLPGFANTSALTDWLATTRNDLQSPALETSPVIADVLEALEALPGSLLARMSGSGASCFALFADTTMAKAAAGALAAARPDWWICQTEVR